MPASSPAQSWVLPHAAFPSQAGPVRTRLEARIRQSPTASPHRVACPEQPASLVAWLGRQPKGGCVCQPHTPFSHLLPKLTLHPSIAEKQVLYQRRIDGRSSSCASNAPCNLFPHRLRDTLPNRQQQYCLGPRSPESHHRMFLLQDVENRPAGLGLVANQM